MPLRSLSEADLLLVLSWRNAPAIRGNMYSRREISEAEHRAWYRHMQNDPQMRWYIHEDKNGTPDGVAYFTQYHPENRSSFWGFYAAPNAHKGTGTAIGIDAIDKAFVTLKLHKLNSEVLENNEISLALHKKLGFKFEGLFRDFYFDGNSYINVVRLGILESEWLIRRGELIESFS